jgi:hypothetical protein
VPLQRFRDLDEARRALWARPDDGTLAGRIRRLWAFSARLAKPYAAPGVRRFRTIEEANADRERSARERARALGAERSAASGTPPSG